jgi:predicted phosphodiesterase
MIVIFSDVHAVAAGLNALKRKIRGFPNLILWCLGDVVGYGHEPVAMFESLDELWQFASAWVWLRGNHDHFLIEWWQSLNQGGIDLPSELQTWARHPCSYSQEKEHQRQLAEYPARLTILSALKPIANPYEGVYLAHGQYSDNDRVALLDYATDSAASIKIQMSWFAKQPHLTRPALLATGHSHVYGLWSYRWSTQQVEEQPILFDKRYYLERDPDLTWIINPGSITFPRSTTRRRIATFVYLEWQVPRPSVIFERIQFNVTPIQIALRTNPCNFHQQLPTE